MEKDGGEADREKGKGRAESHCFLPPVLAPPLKDVRYAAELCVFQLVPVGTHVERKHTLEKLKWLLTRD